MLQRILSNVKVRWERTFGISLPHGSIVCKKVVQQVVDQAKEQKTDISDTEATAKILWDICGKTKNHKEGRFVSYQSGPRSTGLTEFYRSATILAPPKMQLQGLSMK